MMWEEQMRSEVRGQAHENNSSTLSSSRVLSRTISNIKNGLLEWLSKIQNITQWIDSARSDEFAEFVKNTKEVIAKSHLQEFQLDFLSK